MEPKRTLLTWNVDENTAGWRRIRPDAINLAHLQRTENKVVGKNT
jgi:hypothetical protein